jgi:acyl-CoA reductase-like NAD-dependent aldehyde dehydrogenase
MLVNLGYQYTTLPLVNNCAGSLHSLRALAPSPTVDSVASASTHDVSQAIEDAHEVFKSGIWSKSSVISRSEVLTRLSNSLRQRIPDLARIETLQTGRAIREMNAQLGRLPDWL